MTIKRMDHVGIVENDLKAAVEFFVTFGLKVEGKASVEGGWVDRIVGLEGVRSDIVMLKTPDGHSRVELAKFRSPRTPTGDRKAPSNKPGIRHLSFAVKGLDKMVAGLRARGAKLVGTVVQYKDLYKLCYLRGPEGIIVEWAEELAPR